jgi:S1-C subfamily serine protease
LREILNKMRPYFGLLMVAMVLMTASLACRAATGELYPASSRNTTASDYVIPNTSALPPVVVDQQDIQDRLTEVYGRVSPGVVSLRVLTRSGDALGSGFVVDKMGHIVTNYHVVENLEDFEVIFSSGLRTRGSVAGIDLDSDLAVLKVDVPSEELHPLPFGDSDQILVGQTVMAIGNPFGLSGTMTVGIVSATGRTLDSMRQAPGGVFFTAGDLIQTDTAINPGNSGGPLLNLNGEVIGVNRAIRTESFSADGPVNSGIGFAISSNIAKRVVPSLISQGKYEYPYLGISSMREITLIEQEALGLPRSTGVYITVVTPGSPADRAGLKEGTLPTQIEGLNSGGDLITSIDGVHIYSFGEMLTYLLVNKEPGEKVILTVLRDGEEMEVDLILDKRP